MPEGSGPLTALVMLFLSPFQWAQERAARNRLLSPHELELRRASRPPAVAAVVVLGVYLIFGPEIGTGIVALVLLPGPYWPAAAVVLGVPFAYGVAAVIVGAGRCLGMRDRWLAVRAFFKLAFGATATVYLWQLYPPGPISDAWVWALLVEAGVWCFVIAAVRFLLLVLPTRKARIVVIDDIAAGEFQWDGPARRWWQFWKSGPP